MGHILRKLTDKLLSLPEKYIYRYIVTSGMTAEQLLLPHDAADFKSTEPTLPVRLIDLDGFQCGTCYSFEYVPTYPRWREKSNMISKWRKTSIRLQRQSEPYVWLGVNKDVQIYLTQ